MSHSFPLHSRFIVSESQDPFWNLSKEEQFLNALDPETGILFVYRNCPSVVIGKHQNPWAECWTTKLLTSDVKLVRRNSGGGTVFHDAGNLNFSFIVPKEYYNVSQHFELILETLRRQGLSAELNSRNDLVMEGFKFSGSAFCYRKKTVCHHGTLLITSDLERMNRLLKKNDGLICSHAIRSRSSSVRNLSSWKCGLTVDAVVAELAHTFKERANADISVCREEKTNEGSVFQELYQKYSSWEWIFGKTPEFLLTLDVVGKFLNMRVAEGKVQAIFSEEKREGSLTFLDCRFSPDALRKRIQILTDEEKAFFILETVLENLEETVFGKPEHHAN